MAFESAGHAGRSKRLVRTGGFRLDDSRTSGRRKASGLRSHYRGLRRVLLLPAAASAGRRARVFELGRVSRLPSQGFPASAGLFFDQLLWAACHQLSRRGCEVWSNTASRRIGSTVAFAVALFRSRPSYGSRAEERSVPRGADRFLELVSRVFAR